MKDPAALSIDSEELKVRVGASERGLVVTLDGTADSRSMDALDALLTEVHAAALAAAVDEVVVDLRGLVFMNSSCFKALVKWLGEIEDVDASRQYKICLRSNEKHHWQKRSLAGLRCLAVDLVRIQTDA
jgi:anti-anti-sigma factor